MDRKGQTTFEYLLLVGGVVILAVLVIYMLTQSMQTSAKQTSATISGGAQKLTSEANKVIQDISVK